MNKFIIQKKHKPQGFTLVELLFATAILGFMLSITLITFIGVFRFYIWAGTTRTSQESARQLLDDMTREIAAKKIISARTNGSTLCMSDPDIANPTSYTAIQLLGTQVQILTFTDDQCTLLDNTAPVTIISNPNLNVTQLDFTIVSGAVNGFGTLISNPNASLVHKSATINMTITNGLVDPATQACRPGDNYCDVAGYNTAVTERNNGQ